MTGLAAQVLWTRHLSLLVGATVYGFALILSVFLTGLGIGSSAGAAIAPRVASPRHALGYCQILLCASMAWAAYTVTQVLPYWPVDVTLESTPWIRLQMDLVRVLWAMLPAAILWGMSFPLALAAAAGKRQDPGRLVGGLYAANTLGAIFGSLGVSLVMVTWIGSQATQQLLIIVSAAAGLLMFAPLGAAGKEQFRSGTAVVTAVAMVAAVVLAFLVPALPGEVVAYGRFLPVRGIGVNVIYMGEGLTASVAVTEEANGILNYHNAGKVQASSYPQDMRLQRMLGHLTTLIPPEQEDFLVIGLGAGVTAGAVSIDPGAANITIAEIEPLVPEVVSEYFGTHNFDVVDNPKVDIRIDDGRHFLQTTGMMFDGITSDPLDPWVKGAAALYTTEFWTMVKSKLKPGGVVTVFVQLYESTEDAVRSEVATFLDVFPNGAVFANTVSGVGYDVVLLGMADGDAIDVSLVNDRLTSPEYAQVRQSLAEVNFYSAVDLLGTFAGQPSDLGDWLEGAPINIDRNLRLQYLAGMGLNLYRADRIFDNMVRGGVEFPEGFFDGSPELIEQLRRAISVRQGRF
jgi:spermidine synthase